MHKAYQNRFLVCIVHCVPNLPFGTQCTMRTKICFCQFLSNKSMCNASKICFVTQCALRTKLTIWYAMYNAYQKFFVRIVHCIPKLHFGTQYAMRIIFWYSMRIGTLYDLLVFTPYQTSFGTSCKLRTNKILVRITHCVPKCKFGT